MSLAWAPIHTLAVPPAPQRQRRLAGLALLLGVMVWHAWLLAQWAATAPDGEPLARKTGSTGTLRRVQLVALAPAPPAERAATAAAPAGPSRAPASAQVLPRRASPNPSPDQVSAAAAPAAHQRAGAIDAPQVPDAAPDAEAEAAAPAFSADGSALASPPPVYPTTTPAPTERRYALQIGWGAAARSGQATLSWQHDGERYRLALVAQERGAPLINQVSSGGFDAAGLAPERFVDQRFSAQRRNGRSRSANFERERGRISFSGPRIEHPAWPGAQDRLGWIVQLAAIAQAAGGVPPELSLFVVDARGAAGLWTFKLQGSEPINTGKGTVHALKLLREPQQLHDWRVEAWLDPQQGYWPARLRMTLLRSGAVFDLSLLAEPAP